MHDTTDGLGHERGCWEHERRALYAQTVADVAGHVAEKEDSRLARQAEADAPPSMRRTVFSGGVVVACVVTAGVLFGPAVVSAPPPPYAVGARGDGDAPGLSGAIAGLWDVRAALDRYTVENAGAVPESIGDLAGAPPVCPGCGKAWLFERGEQDAYLIACASPRSHERAEVKLDHRVGPPQVSSSTQAGLR